MEANREQLFDNRVWTRKVARGQLTREEYQKYLDSLEDSAEHAVEAETRFVHTNQADAVDADED